MHFSVTHSAHLTISLPLCHLPDSLTRSCCSPDPLLSASSGSHQVRDQILGRFQRIVKGDSFRVPAVAAAASQLPPARVLGKQEKKREGEKYSGQ